MERNRDQAAIPEDPFVLDQVERALRQHQQVKEAAVVVQHHGDEERVVAYVVPTEDGPTVSQLRSYLESICIPTHSVPSVFVSLDSLPLTSTGSIDRSALPPADPVWSAAETSYTAPRNAFEAAIAAIWAEVLLVERVGIHDDFLELGGDSLLATQIIARIWERLGTEIPLAAMFERSTVAEIVDQFFGDSEKSQG